MLYVNKSFDYGKPRAHLVFILWRTVKLDETEYCQISFWVVARGCVYLEPDLPIGYVDLSLGSQNPRAVQQTVVRIESIAVTVYDKFDIYTFVNNLCFSFLFICSDFVSMPPGSSNEFSRISEWPLVKPNADRSVDIIEALWLRLAFRWIVSIVMCELGNRFDTHLIKA